MSSALIGYTGFVGSNLARDGHFEHLINRANLESLRGARLDRIVCAGLPAAKWLVNQEPEQDAENLQRLQDVLKDVQASRFTLISTIDVYPRLVGADEDFDCSQAPNHAYGRHRLEFERFVTQHFPRVHIVRLPALFGAGLKKNVLFDLLHDNGLDRIQPNSRFQWYPLRRLAADLDAIEARDLALINLFTEPLETQQILTQLFPGKRVGHPAERPVHYDLRTRYGAVLGGDSNYVMSRSAVMDEMRQFVNDARTLQ